MLTPLQERVARLFLALPEAERFALAGGAALVVRGEVARATEDLDFFAPDAEDVRLATAALRHALEPAGLVGEVVRSGPAFSRLVVTDRDGERVLVDLGYDQRMRAVEPTDVDPVLALDELGADKLLALFGRAEARDFVDVHALAQRLGVDRLLALAKEKDSGFDEYVLATMLDGISRLPRAEFDVDDPTYAKLTTFYRELRAHLVQRTLNGW